VNEPSIIGESGLLMDYETGQVLFEKDAHIRRYPSSTTKILTALIILENHTLDEVVIVDAESPFVEGSKIFIFDGESLTVEQLLNAMLIASANDCAEALAVYHSGSIENFAMEMNKRAYELGALDSHFVNPHGLHNEDHYTTAYDLAILAQEAYSHPAFQEIVAKKTYSIPPTPYQKETRYMSTTNHFLNDSKLMLYNGKYVRVQYDIVDGMKTGYTVVSKNNLVSTAQKNGDRLISVVLKSNSNNIYVDSRTLLDYGFDHFKYQNFTFSGNRIVSIAIDNGTVDFADLYAESSVSGMIPADLDPSEIIEKQTLYPIELPIEPGEPLGTLQYFINDQMIGETFLITDQKIVEKTLAMTVKNTLVRKDGLGNLNIHYYLEVLFNLIISFLLWRTIITLIRIIRNRRRKKSA
jgi:D-alanyl-D-alanine carboxypeptidase (penicillin-binding protein 5/6)